LKSDILR